jgi:hypothetical protein
MTGRSVALLLLLALGLGACGSPSTSGPSGGSRSALQGLADGVVTPDSSLVYSTAGDGEDSVLIATDTSTGEDLTATAVPDNHEVGVASATGSVVVLVEGEGAHSPYEFVPRERTRILVARPGKGKVRSYELEGNFEPEAFSTDTRKIFLIEYLDDEGLRYRVRMMRLRTGRVFPVGRLTKFAPRSMRGTGRVQAYSLDHNYLYTLYTKQPPNYAHQDHDDVHDEGTVHAFVHVLNLRRGWAHCIDLPMPFGMDGPATKLELSKDGRHLFASDGKRVAVVDTRELKTLRVEDIARDSASATN